MSNSEKLSKVRVGTKINGRSKKEDQNVQDVVEHILDDLKKEYPNIEFFHKSRLYTNEMKKELEKKFPDYSFTDNMDKTYITPDGGFTYCVINGKAKPVLIAEVKSQGTNDKRLEEGKKKQAKGNAIERLGKNLMGIKSYLIGNSCMPFVVFGDGCDFEEGSTIIDRVKTMSNFLPLNTINIKNGILDNGSFYFREEPWTYDEIYNICLSIAKMTIEKYLEEK